MPNSSSSFRRTSWGGKSCWTIGMHVSLVFDLADGSKWELLNSSTGKSDTEAMGVLILKRLGVSPAFTTRQSDLSNFGSIRAVATAIIRFFKEGQPSTSKVRRRYFRCRRTGTKDSERGGSVTVLVKNNIESLSKLFINGATTKPSKSEIILFAQSITARLSCIKVIPRIHVIVNPLRTWKQVGTVRPWMLTSRVTVPRLFRGVPEADTRDEMSSVFRADNGTLSVFRNCSDKQFLLAPLSSKAFTLRLLTRTTTALWFPTFAMSVSRRLGLSPSTCPQRL